MVVSAFFVSNTYPLFHTGTQTHSGLPVLLHSTPVYPVFNLEAGKWSMTLLPYSSESLINHRVLLILLLNISPISPLLCITSATTQSGHCCFVPGTGSYLFSLSPVPTQHLEWHFWNINPVALSAPKQSSCFQERHRHSGIAVTSMPSSVGSTVALPMVSVGSAS